jgi:hypothetical protein
MRETIEFRIPEEHASRWLAKHDGVSLGDSVRKLIIETNDPRMQVVAEAERTLKLRGRTFFTSWRLRRSYTKADLAAARVFRLKITAIFEPAGEVCGTKYDESTACELCGTGAEQLGPLILDVKRIPKGKSFAKTIAGEIIVAQRVVDLFEEYDITGAQFYPVRAKNAKDLKPVGWYQFKVLSADAEIVAPTRIGVDPFDEDPVDCRCSGGDLLGLNLLSETFAKSSTVGDADVVASHQFVGIRRGLLRPERIILISPKVRRVIDSLQLKGCEIEVAHLVGDNGS